MDGMSAIVNFVPCCWFLSAKLCTVAAKLPDLGRWPSRLCSSDMISAANSTRVRDCEQDVDAEPLFSSLLLFSVWGRGSSGAPGRTFRHWLVVAFPWYLLFLGLEVVNLFGG